MPRKRDASCSSWSSNSSGVSGESLVSLLLLPDAIVELSDAVGDGVDDKEGASDGDGSELCDGGALVVADWETSTDNDGIGDAVVVSDTAGDSDADTTGNDVTDAGSALGNSEGSGDGVGTAGSTDGDVNTGSLEDDDAAASDGAADSPGVLAGSLLGITDDCGKGVGVTGLGFPSSSAWLPSQRSVSTVAATFKPPEAMSSPVERSGSTETASTTSAANMTTPTRQYDDAGAIARLHGRTHAKPRAQASRDRQYKCPGLLHFCDGCFWRRRTRRRRSTRVCTNSSVCF